MQPPSASAPPALPLRTICVILGAALLQALALQGALGSGGSVIDSTGGLALFAVIALLPVSVQLLADHAHKPLTWVLLLVLGGALSGFGWHHAAHVMPGTRDREGFVSLGWFARGVLLWWLLVLPFLQCRLETGRWRPDYPQLFSQAWSNGFLLLGAVLGTGLLLVILRLGSVLLGGLPVLSGLLGFRTQSSPVLIALCFGGALCLVRSGQRLMGGIRPLLNALKWLALPVLVLSLISAAALLFRVPLHSGPWPFPTTWLLGLIAWMVLWVNAVWQDGSVERPRPTWLASACRLCMPLALLLALTAVYRLVLRTEQAGLTVTRVAGLLMAGAMLVCCAGYTLSALRPGRWPAGIARVNVATALVLILVIGACLTPLLSPWRLSADSQYRRILQEQDTQPRPGAHAADSRFTYLRQSAGAYGRARLDELTALRAHPHAQEVRAQAAAVRAQAREQDRVREADALSQLAVYPAGRTLGKDLQARLMADWKSHDIDDHGPFVGIFADLNDDKVEEFVLQQSYKAWLYQNQEGRWRRIGNLHRPGSVEGLKTQLDQGHLSVEPSHWDDLVIGPHRLRVGLPLQ